MVGTFVDQPAFHDAMKAREQRIAMLAESGVISITPAVHTGPITFEITTLRVPPLPPSRCTLHKGLVHDDAVVCKKCGAVYCKACASQLADLAESCFSCHEHFEP